MAGTEEVRFVFSMEDHFSQQAKRAEANVGGLQKGISSLGPAIAAAFSIGAVTSFGKAVIDSYSRAELFTTSIKTMLHGNAEEATALNDRLVNLAKTTPFELTEVQDATKQLLAFGSSAGEIEGEIRTLGDVSAGIGAPIKDIAYLYGTVRTQGRAMTMDINQFANRGIPIWKELEKITGKSGLALRKYVEEGKVGFPQIQQVMANLTKEGGQFFNLMEEQSKTLGGQISNLNDGWEQFKVNIGTTFSENLKESIGFLSEHLTKINDEMARSNRLQKSLKSQGVGLRYGEVNQGAELTGELHQLETIREMKTTDDDKINRLEKLSKYLSKNFRKENILKLMGIGEGPDAEKYLRRIALIKGEIAHYKGEIDLAKSKELNDKKGDSAKDAKKETSKVKQTQYTNITINIDKMNEGGINITTNNLPASAEDAYNLFLKSMISAVQDAQIVAGI